jgi:hypothetical protein
MITSPAVAAMTLEVVERSPEPEPGQLLPTKVFDIRLAGDGTYLIREVGTADWRPADQDWPKIVAMLERQTANFAERVRQPEGARFGFATRRTSR